jgi:outer membrane protein assembly factor BamB
VTRQRRVKLVAVGVLLLVAVGVGLYLRGRNDRGPGLPTELTQVTPEDENLSEDDESGPPLGVRIDHEANRVVRENLAGKALWTTPLDGYLGRVRPPHVLADDTRAYVTHADGVTALDVRTGAVLWHSPGPADRMLLSGSLLLATECSSGEQVAKAGRWVTARDTVTGREVFRVSLPVDRFDPLPIEEAAGLFLVQKSEDPGGEGLALLIDRTGQVRHRLDRQVVTTHRLAEGDRLVLTSRDVVRLADAGGVKWSVPFRHREWIAGGGFVPLPDGGVVAFLYGRINDSGVQLLRFDPDNGRQLWKTYCDRVGVAHSEYYHRAIVKSVGDHLRVTSRGSYGTFVEVLNWRDGRSVGRDQRKR